MGSTLQKLGVEQRYFRDLASMSRIRLCISSFQDPGPHQPCVENVQTESLLEQLRAALQVSQSVATAWSDGAALDCSMTFNISIYVSTWTAG